VYALVKGAVAGALTIELLAWCGESMGLAYGAALGGHHEHAGRLCAPEQLCFLCVWKGVHET
jgi:hypothetical protein